MARQRTDVIEASAAPVLDESKFQELSEKANALVVLNEQDKANVQAMAAEFSYTGPTDPDTLEQVCHMKGAAAANSIFEYGVALLLLRESCLHGDWMDRFERMAISRRTAHNYMAIALKFKGIDVRAALGKLGVTKLLELSALDDAEIEALAAGESVRGVTIGQVDKMSVLELKKKIADLEADKSATEQLLTAKNKKLDELARKSKKFDIHTDWPEQVRGAVELTDEVSRGMEKSLDMLMQVCTQAMAATPQGEAEQEVFAQGTAALAARVRDAMARQRELVDTVDEHFRQTLGHFLAD